MVSQVVMPKPEKFDPTYGYSLEDLLQVDAPAAPSDFDSFWQRAYRKARSLDLGIKIQENVDEHGPWVVHKVFFNSTQNTRIGAWLMVPRCQPPTRGFVVGHGYGGRAAPDYHLPFHDAAFLFPCCRGIGISPNPPISSDPMWHVLHDIDKKDRYILRGCVEDTWLSISTLLTLYPFLRNRMGYLGISFSGGVGALALAQETRISRAHLNVPSFGHHRLRLRLPTRGSGRAVQNFYRKHKRMALNTLRYYDAANAAENINIPMHLALALEDPVVAPPGQFAIYNHLKHDKSLFTLTKGHAEYLGQEQQKKALLNELSEFFEPLSRDQ